MAVFASKQLWLFLAVTGCIAACSDANVISSEVPKTRCDQADVLVDQIATSWEDFSPSHTIPVIDVNQGIRHPQKIFHDRPIVQCDVIAVDLRATREGIVGANPKFSWSDQPRGSLRHLRTSNGSAWGRDESGAHIIFEVERYYFVADKTDARGLSVSLDTKYVHSEPYKVVDIIFPSAGPTE